MKRFGLMVAICIATLSSVQAAVTLDAELQAALPSGQVFLPGPPEIGSLIWQDDSIKYFEYKALSRVLDPVRNEYWDSVWAKMNEPYDFALYRLSADSVMNAPFISVSWTQTAPNKYNVTKTRNTTDFPKLNDLEELCEKMKSAGTSNLWRTRPRPYYYFGDWYSGRYYAQNLSDASSYPSGHGYFAGLFGMCMLYIDPANALPIKRMMDEWAFCRLILGAHWNTDVQDGKTLGAIAFAIAMNYDQFRTLVEEAKAELEAYRTAQEQNQETAVETAPELNTAGKTLNNGSLFIERNDLLYNASGAIVR